MKKYLFISAVIFGLYLSCIKEDTGCADIKQVYRYSRKLVIDFGVVCDSELIRYESYPRYSQVSAGCDTNQLEIIITYKK